MPSTNCPCQHAPIAELIHSVFDVFQRGFLLTQANIGSSVLLWMLLSQIRLDH